jgi:hypothetical protein
VKKWDTIRCFVRQGKVISGKGEDNILGQEKVILLLAGDVGYGSGELDWMGQVKMIRTGESVYGSGEFDIMGQEKMIR